MNQISILAPLTMGCRMLGSQNGLAKRHVIFKLYITIKKKGKQLPFRVTGNPSLAHSHGKPRPLGLYKARHETKPPEFTVPRSNNNQLLQLSPGLSIILCCLRGVVFIVFCSALPSRSFVSLHPSGFPRC